MKDVSDIEQFAELVKDIRFVMFTTLDQNRSFIHSRPMTLLEAEFDGDLWFFASHSSDLVRQIENYALVNLTFSNAKDFSFLSAQGFAEIIQNKDKQEELWNPFYRAWFSQGIDDPDLCLIKVVVKSVDYWKSPESKLVRLMGFTRSIFSGKKNDHSLGYREHLELKN